MNITRILLPIAILFSVFTTASGQFGASAHYLSGQADNWEWDPVFSSQDRLELMGSGWQAGIDYWFRLKNTRIEFLPTLAVSQQTQTTGQSPFTLETEVQGVHFLFNTNIYFMDLSGDCDCPTFSKEGPTLQKGLFLQLSPGYSLFDFELTDNESGQTYEANDGAFSIGAGLGFDLGLSDFFTFTPMAGLRYYPAVNWETLKGENGIIFPTEVEAESSLIQYQIGVRLGFRLDN